MRKLLALLPLPVLAACGGSAPPPAEPPAPPALAYELPDDPIATYVQGDTAVVQVDAGGQMIDVTVASRATMSMTFEAAGDGAIRVNATIDELDARAANPMAPAQTADESEISGPVVFTLSRRGEGTLVSAPDIGEAARTFISPGVMAATFFPRLPARAVGPGDSWTDTITVATDEEETSMDATSIITYTARGDTLVEGRSLLLVTMIGEDERRVEGNLQGMDMLQEAAGTSEGYFLWDATRRLPVEVVYTTDSTGTMEVTAAPFPLGLRAESTTRIVLQETPPAG